MHAPAANVRCKPAAVASNKGHLLSAQARRRCLRNAVAGAADTIKATDTGLLGIPGLHEPGDCLITAATAVEQIQQIAATAAPPAELEALRNDVKLRSGFVAPALQLLNERHPDAAWRQAAGPAVQLLEMQCCRWG